MLKIRIFPDRYGVLITFLLVIFKYNFFPSLSWQWTLIPLLIFTGSNIIFEFLFYLTFELRRLRYLKQRRNSASGNRDIPY